MTRKLAIGIPAEDQRFAAPPRAQHFSGSVIVVDPTGALKVLTPRSGVVPDRSRTEVKTPQVAGQCRQLV